MTRLTVRALLSHGQQKNLIDNQPKKTMKNLLKKVTLKVLTMSVMTILQFSGCTEETFSPALTETFTLTAQSSGATYPIKVALPAMMDTTKSYATVYVLDGDDNFALVANECRESAMAMSVDNVFVVSIGYGNSRDLDYTPTKTGSSTGGAPAFLDFIRNQLIPEMEQRYPVDTARAGRVILGHSYGGLFGAYAFASNNLVFGNYLMLSPSLWYDDEVTLLLEKANRERNKDRRQLVFLGIGEMENMGKMQAPLEAFYQVLSTQYSNASLSKNREKDLAHMGSKNPNIKLGLSHYFNHRGQ